jgi:hypothetical protein
MVNEASPRGDINTVPNTANNSSLGKLNYSTALDFDPEIFKELSLHEVMAGHIQNCEQCERAANEALPAPNVRVSGPVRASMCNGWFGLLQAYSDYEGKRIDVRGPESVNQPGWRDYGHPEA